MENKRDIRVYMDVNGCAILTLHTLINWAEEYLPDKHEKNAERWQAVAQDLGEIIGAFELPINGHEQVSYAYNTAARILQGMPLRTAVKVSLEIPFIEGFDDMHDQIHQNGGKIVFVTTGPSVFSYAKMEKGYGGLYDHLGNTLEFGVNGMHDQRLTEDELREQVKAIIAGTEKSQLKIEVTGHYKIPIKEPESKVIYLNNHLDAENERLSAAGSETIKPSNVVVIGDSIFDSAMLRDASINGRVPIAFNRSIALDDFVSQHNLWAEAQRGQGANVSDIHTVYVKGFGVANFDPVRRLILGH